MESSSQNRVANLLRCSDHDDGDVRVSQRMVRPWSAREAIACRIPQHKAALARQRRSVDYPVHVGPRRSESPRPLPRSRSVAGVDAEGCSHPERPSTGEVQQLQLADWLPTHEPRLTVGEVDSARPGRPPPRRWAPLQRCMPHPQSTWPPTRLGGGQIASPEAHTSAADSTGWGAIHPGSEFATRPRPKSQDRDRSCEGCQGQVEVGPSLPASVPLGKIGSQTDDWGDLSSGDQPLPGRDLVPVDDQLGLRRRHEPRDLQRVQFGRQ